MSIFSFHLVENWSAIIIPTGIHLNFPYLWSTKASKLTDTLGISTYTLQLDIISAIFQHGGITLTKSVSSLFQCFVEELPLTSFFVDVLFHSHC